MTGAALAERPACPRHGPMTLRQPPGGHTREQRWCGTWYDCQRCRDTALLPSAGLAAHLAAQAAAGRQRP